MSSDLYVAVYSISIPLLILFAVYALYHGHLERKKKTQTQNVEYFIAAHHTQPMGRVAYSLISTSLGAWIVFSPSSYATYAGYIGLITYSVSAGITILIPAFFGPYIQRYSNAISLNDYVLKRYGVLAQYFVALLCLYSMAVGLAAEYTAVGDLFEKIVGGDRIFIVVFIGVLTSVYTAYGGLAVSVITDQIQGIFVILMNVLIAIFIASTFTLDTTEPLNEYLAANKDGYASIAAMPLGLAGAVVFSESFWQKAWIATNSRDLKIASVIAAFVVTIIVFLFGLYGYIAAWSGFYADDPNLQLFAIFPGYKPTWIIVILSILAMVMSESAVDSYQIGIVSSISSCLLKKAPLWVTQMAVFLINIPIIIVSLKGYGIINLFVSGNLITAAASIPLLLGLWKGIEEYYDVVNLFIGTILSLFLAGLWGAYEMNDVSEGLNLIFYVCYCWESFTIVVGGSVFIALMISLVRYGVDVMRGKEKRKKGKNGNKIEMEECEKAIDVKNEENKETKQDEGVKGE